MRDSVTQAKDAFSVGLAVVGVGAVGCVSLAWRLSSDEERLDRARAALALISATAALLLTGAASIIMVPLAWRTLFVNDGAVSGYLVAYDLVVVVILGSGLASAAALIRAARHLIRAVSVYFR